MSKLVKMGHLFCIILFLGVNPIKNNHFKNNEFDNLKIIIISQIFCTFSPHFEVF